MFLALSIPHWPTGVAAHELPFRLLAIAPRATIARADGLAWLDARSLDVDALARRALDIIREMGIPDAHAAASRVPVVASVAARYVAAPFLVVTSGAERRFFASLPLAVLAPPPRLASLFSSVGLEKCGDLAALDRESVEVRFGRDGLTAWKHARADDPRLIFRAQPRTLPNASIDWTEFATADVEQLVFVMHSMLGTVCESLARDGLGARSITITLALEGRNTVIQQVGSARPSADRKLWLRLVRRALEKLSLPDRVAGIAIEVDAAGAPPIRQGDLFDLSFASAQAAEAAVAHVIDLQGDAVVGGVRRDHMLPEERMQWKTELAPDLDEGRRNWRHGNRVTGDRLQVAPCDAPASDASNEVAVTCHLSPSVVVPCHLSPGSSINPQLTLRLLPTPREIDVLSTPRRGFPSPVQYLDNGIPYSLAASLGPQCLSGNHAEAAYSREYYQGVRSDGSVVLMFRDGNRKQWYLAGTWD